MYIMQIYYTIYAFILVILKRTNYLRKINIFTNQNEDHIMVSFECRKQQKQYK